MTLLLNVLRPESSAFIKSVLVGSKESELPVIDGLLIFNHLMALVAREFLAGVLCTVSHQHNRAGTLSFFNCRQPNARFADRSVHGVQQRSAPTKHQFERRC